MKISLTNFNKKYIDKTFDWIRNPEMRRSFLMRGEASYDKHIEYFRKLLKDSSQRVYAIKYGQRHVGNCGIKRINMPKRDGEVWIYIGEPSLRRKGIGHEALKSLLKKCFKGLNFKKVYLHVADFNAAAIRLYEKNGFTKAGVEEGGDWACHGCKVLRLELKREKWI